MSKKMDAELYVAYVWSRPEEIGLIEAKHWPESLFCRVEG
jgi:hypothetical protein